MCRYDAWAIELPFVAVFVFFFFFLFIFSFLLVFVVPLHISVLKRF